MHIRHLETFLTIVDHGTLTAAAAALLKTQAAVSQDLQALESSLGVELLKTNGPASAAHTGRRGVGADGASADWRNGRHGSRNGQDPSG